jgi:hypothetical protein
MGTPNPKFYKKHKFYPGEFIRDAPFDHPLEFLYTVNCGAYNPTEKRFSGNVMEVSRENKMPHLSVPDKSLIEVLAKDTGYNSNSTQTTVSTKVSTQAAINGILVDSAWLAIAVARLLNSVLKEQPRGLDGLPLDQPYVNGIYLSKDLSITEFLTIISRVPTGNPRNRTMTGDELVDYNSLCAYARANGYNLEWLCGMYLFRVGLLYTSESIKLLQNFSQPVRTVMLGHGHVFNEAYNPLVLHSSENRFDPTPIIGELINVYKSCGVPH